MNEIMQPDTLNSPAYPPAPWAMHGEGLLIFAVPPARTPDMNWPEGLPVQPLAFGRTFAGYYIAEYDTPLVLEGAAPWREWGNITAYGRHNRGNGFWINRMAVDCEAALAGGAEIWGLDKVFGKINWQTFSRNGKAELFLPEGRIELVWKEYGPAVGMTREFWFLSRIDGMMQRYSTRLRAQFQISRVEIKRRDLPAFSSLSYGNRYWAVRFRDADIRISAPRAYLD